MKNLIFLLLLLSSFALPAQQYSVEVLDTTLYGNPGDPTFYGDIDLYNDQGSGFQMRWERIETVVPAGWTVSNCDPQMCHGENVTSSSFILPSLPSSLNTHFYPHGVSGTGYVKVKIWVTANPADSTILTYYGVAGTVHLDELLAEEVQIFPSLTSGPLNIMFPHTGQSAEALVMDLMGQQIARFPLAIGNNSHRIELHGLSQGLYLVQLNIDGRPVRTQKIYKQ